MRTATHSSASDRLALTGAELAKLLGISRRHLHSLDQAGKVPRPIRLGHSVRWPRCDIERWLAAGAPERAVWEASVRQGADL